MADMKPVMWYRTLPGHPNPRRALKRPLLGSITCSLLCAVLASALLGAPPTAVHAQRQETPAFHVELTESFFGAQALSAKPDDLAHPDHARFTITNSSELWYSVKIYTASDALKPVAANPGDDLVSAAMAESGLLMPSGIIPINPDLSLYQHVTLESHFTGPDQQVKLELNPFSSEAGALDIVRLVLMFVGQQEVAQEAGILIPGALKEIVRDFNNVRDLTNLVNDFVKLLNAVVHGESPVGPANAVVNDLLHVAGDASELAVLGAALGLALGKHVNINPLKIVLGIGDAAKYLTDQIRSLGAYLFLNGNYPTITLRTVADTTPSGAPPTGQPGSGPIVRMAVVANGSLDNITAGPDGNLWFTDDRINYADSAIGRITPAGRVTEYPIPGAFYPGQNARSWKPMYISTGPDGNLWFNEAFPVDTLTSSGNVGAIGRITPAGQITVFPSFSPESRPFGPVAGPDGSIWFADWGTNSLGRMTPDGHITEFPLAVSALSRPVVGADGKLWFTYLSGIGNISLGGAVALYPQNALCPKGACNLAPGPDGALWVADFQNSSVARITLDGKATAFPAASAPINITAGPDGEMWFTTVLISSTYHYVVGKVATDGRSTVLSVPWPAEDVIGGIANGPDGKLWLVGSNVNSGGGGEIWRVSLA